jgi:hypothetical protein
MAGTGVIPLPGRRNCSAGTGYPLVNMQKTYGKSPFLRGKIILKSQFLRGKSSKFIIFDM